MLRCLRKNSSALIQGSIRYIFTCFYWNVQIYISGSQVSPTFPIFWKMLKFQNRFFEVRTNALELLFWRYADSPNPCISAVSLPKFLFSLNFMYYDSWCLTKRRLNNFEIIYQSNILLFSSNSKYLPHLSLRGSNVHF